MPQTGPFDGRVEDAEAGKVLVGAERVDAREDLFEVGIDEALLMDVVFIVASAVMTVLARRRRAGVARRR